MDLKLIQFIKRFLYDSFSIEKVKDQNNRKFKRGVTMDIGYVMYVSDYGREGIRMEVSKQLKDIFNVDDEIITEVMVDYLIEPKNIKTKGRPKKRPTTNIGNFN